MTVAAQHNDALPQEHIDALFADAHTAHAFTDQHVSDEQINAIYDILKWAPTSMNMQPLRITWVRSQESRDRVVDAMFDGNKDKVRSAPLTAVLSADSAWFEHFATFAPWAIERQSFFAENPQVAQKVARDNAFIQAGYFITAVRSIGLAAGPMGGFDAVKMDELINQGTSHKAILVVNLGQPSDDAFRPRGGRLESQIATRVI